MEGGEKRGQYAREDKKDKKPLETNTYLRKEAWQTRAQFYHIRIQCLLGHTSEAYLFLNFKHDLEG